MGRHSKPEDNSWSKILEIARIHRDNRCQCTSSFRASHFNERFPKPQVIYPQIHKELIAVLEMEYPEFAFRDAFRKKWFPDLPPENPPKPVTDTGHLRALTLMRDLT